MLNVETVTKPAVVEGFIVTFTPDQLRYVVAVIGATVASGSIPRYAQGMYDVLSDVLQDAGLVDKHWNPPGERNTDEDGVPYAARLFRHLGLEAVTPSRS